MVMLIFDASLHCREANSSAENSHQKNAPAVMGLQAEFTEADRLQVDEVDGGRLVRLSHEGLPDEMLPSRGCDSRDL